RQHAGHQPHGQLGTSGRRGLVVSTVVRGGRVARPFFVGGGRGGAGKGRARREEAARNIGDADGHWGQRRRARRDGQPGGGHAAGTRRGRPRPRALRGRPTPGRAG